MRGAIESGGRAGLEGGHGRREGRREAIRERFDGSLLAAALGVTVGDLQKAWRDAASDRLDGAFAGGRVSGQRAVGIRAALESGERPAMEGRQERREGLRNTILERFDGSRVGRWRER